MLIRVTLVDSNRLIRDGIKHALPAGEFVCAGEAASARAALELFARRIQTDVLVLDYDLPDADAFDLMAEMHRRDLNPRTVVIMNFADELRILQLVRKGGVQGIILKNDSLDLLFSACRHVSSGGTYFSPGVAAVLMAVLQNNPAGLRSENDNLSPRERQVVRLIANGMSNKEIARFLSIEVGTVRTHRKVAMKKMGVNNTATLVREAHKRDISRVRVIRTDE